MCEFEKTKHNLGVVSKHVIESVQIGYNLAMKSFMEEAKNRDFREYYYKILDIRITPTYSPTQTHMDDGETKENEDEGEVRDRANNPRDA